MDEDQAPPFSISIDAGMLGGVWANFAQVTHSPYEFTLDFVRLDFSQQPPTGIVVSRVSMSPLFVRQLIDALSRNWDALRSGGLGGSVEPEPELRYKRAVLNAEADQADARAAWLEGYLARGDGLDSPTLSGLVGELGPLPVYPPAQPRFDRATIRGPLLGTRP